MKQTLLVTAMLAAGLISVSAFAEHHAGMHETGKQMKQQAETSAKEMKHKGKEKAKQAGDAAAAGADQAAEGAETAVDATQEAAAGAAEAAADTADKGKKAAADKVPPGMTKRDAHPATGKGSETGQAAREAAEKPWYQFWE